VTALADYRHSALTRRALGGLARVACPPQIEEHDLVDAVVDHVELSMRSLPDLFRRGLVTGIAAYEQMARFVPGHRGRPASALPFEAATRYFERWRKSPLMPQRELIKGLKGLLCVGYYEQPAVKAEIDYLPERWIEKVKRRRLSVYSEEIARHETSLFEPDPLPLDLLFGREPTDAKKGVG
jgi:hypothetical protein